MPPSLLELPQSRLWKPLEPRSHRRSRRSPFERRYARSRSGLWIGPEPRVECAAPTVSQTAVGENGGPTATTTATYSFAQTAGNTNLFFIAGNVGDGTAPTALGDTNGNTYALVGSLYDLTFTSSYFIAVYIAHGIRAASAGANTVTVTYDGFNNGGYTLYAVETTPAVVDSTLGCTFSQSASSDPSSTGPMSTGHSNVLAFGYCWTGGYVSAPSLPWVMDSNSPTGFGSGLETQTVAAAGTPLTATFPQGGPSAWIQVLLGLYTPPVGPGPIAQVFSAAGW